MNARRTYTRGWWILIASALASACSGGGSSTNSADLVGTWSITKYELVSKSSSTTRLDLIAAGATATLVMKADGTYQMTMTAPGTPAETVSGTWQVSTDVLTTTQVGRSGNSQFNCSLSGTTLTLTGADAEWDFNGDDVDEPAKLNISASRT